MGFHDAALAARRAGVARALAAGVRFGRLPASPQVDALVLTARHGGAGWADIARMLNDLMAQGGPRPPQGSASWCRSSVREIFTRANRAAQAATGQSPPAE